MKLRKSLLIIPTLIASISLSGCSLIRSIFSMFTGGGDNMEITTIEKSPLDYTYKDYVENNLYTISSCPSVGNPKLLVIPVWFTDSDSYIRGSRETLRRDIQTAYFGDDAETGWKSVKGYYSQLSERRLQLDGIVSNWYDCGYHSNYFYSEEEGLEHTCDLVTSAVNWYKSYSGDSTLSSFDTDNDGYLDGVILIYASPNHMSLGNDFASNMWAYTYWLQEENYDFSRPIPNAFFWASFDFLYGEDNNISYFYYGNTDYCKLDTHTFIHEMGHVLGLVDYYDYSNQYVPAGAFSMQDYNIGSHDPYSAMALGWVNPIIPTETCRLSLKPFQQNGHDLVLLSTNPDINSPFAEYLLVEFYSPTGLNQFDVKHQYFDYYNGPTKYGIRVWHVDARLTYYVESTDWYSYTLESEVREGKYYTHAMTNTYYEQGLDDYCSPLGKQYADFNILQLIRNDRKETYRPTNAINNGDLFEAGYTFSMETYKSQFVNGPKLNSNIDLGWTFKINSVKESEAIITFYKQ